MILNIIQLYFPDCSLFFQRFAMTFPWLSHDFSSGYEVHLVLGASGASWGAVVHGVWLGSPGMKWEKPSTSQPYIYMSI